MQENLSTPVLECIFFLIRLLIHFLVNTGGGSKRIPWSATVNVVLVEGRGLKAMDMEGTSDPYCKVR